MVVIQYDMAYRVNGVTKYETRNMAGKFESIDHFNRFRKVEETYNRYVSNARIIKKDKSQ